MPKDDIRIFITGSGSAPLAEPLGAEFVQEVNAVTLSVETMHPDVNAVVELGGQDAKIIVFKENKETGQETAVSSMNDKCASGTRGGVTNHRRSPLKSLDSWEKRAI